MHVLASPPNQLRGLAEDRSECELRRNMARSRSDSQPKHPLPPSPDFEWEKAAIAKGLWPVAGTDEAGRGPLAGPVVAAAVILDPDNLPGGLNDSKKLTAKRRLALFDEIIAKALAIGIASASAEEIDRTNILKASLECMRRAVAALPSKPVLVLADGRDVPPGLDCKGEAIIKGDAISLSISAASIIAKVMRDRMMIRCAEEHAAYGFGKHMGYGTLQHRTAIIEDGGVNRIHRFSFAPLKG